MTRIDGRRPAARAFFFREFKSLAERAGWKNFGHRKFAFARQAIWSSSGVLRLLSLRSPSSLKLSPHRRLFHPMSTLAEIEAAVEALPVNQKQALLEFLSAKLDGGSVPVANRIAGLHEGAWEVAPDFDAPLLDEFWLGREA